MKIITLSVCPQGNKVNGKFKQFSLRVDAPPARANLKKLFINLYGDDIEVQNLRTYINHGRIISPDVTGWIMFNELNHYPMNKPTRLIFIFNEKSSGNIHSYTLYQPQGL